MSEPLAISRRGTRSSPSSDHVVVRSTNGIVVTEVLEKARGAAPEHRDGASREMANRLRPDVLLRAAVAKVAGESASIQ